MTDREKAFVLNGLRNFTAGAFAAHGLSIELLDKPLINVARRLGVPVELLEVTRIEQQEFVAEAKVIFAEGDRNGD